MMSNAQELYDEIKNALDYFGIRFHDMHQMSIEFREGAIVFFYLGKRLEVCA